MAFINFGLIRGIYKFAPQDCEEDPITKSGEGQELLAKCRAGLIDYQVIYSCRRIQQCHEDDIRLFLPSFQAA